MSRVQVQHFERRALPGVFSIERVFEAVRAALPGDVEVQVHRNRFHSLGLLPRLSDAIAARRRAGAINHVLGDVHYLAWFLPRRGLILTVHDCASLARLRGVRRWLLWLGWYWWPMRRAERVTTISEFTRGELARWLPRSQRALLVIPPPLARGFGPRAARPRGARLRLLQVGTAENKNLPRVIEACRGLPVELVIIGALAPADRGRLEALEVPFEVHVGLDDAALIACYEACDVVIFASTYEGFGLPIIEAQSVGRPVITSRIGATRETAGGAAFLVDPFDAQDVRRGIQRLIEDAELCADLVHRGYANAARYAPEQVAAAYAALYRELAAAQGRSAVNAAPAPSPEP